MFSLVKKNKINKLLERKSKQPKGNKVSNTLENGKWGRWERVINKTKPRGKRKKRLKNCYGFVVSL